MHFQHKPHNKQQNKPHTNKKKGSVTRQFYGVQAVNAALNKETRFNQYKQLQSKKRQELFNKRRGITDNNPTAQGRGKVIAFVPLSEYADVQELK